MTILEILKNNTDEALFVDFSIEDFANAVEHSSNVAKSLGISATKLSNFCKVAFPNKLKYGKIRNYLLSLNNSKYCGGCKTVKSKESFRANKYNSDGLNSQCAECHSLNTKTTQPARQAQYRATQLNAIPSWADLEKIKEIYENCPKGFHVDHIIPLQGANICGLHIETNLQYLLAEDNVKKSNKF